MAWRISIWGPLRSLLRSSGNLWTLLHLPYGRARFMRGFLSLGNCLKPRATVSFLKQSSGTMSAFSEIISTTLPWSNMNLGTLGLSGHRPRQCMTFALLNHFAPPFVSLCVGWVQYLLWVLFQTTFNVPPQTETGADTVWQFDRLTRWCTICQTYIHNISGSGAHTVWHVKCSQQYTASLAYVV